MATTQVYNQTFEGSGSLPGAFLFDSGWSVDTTSKVAGTNSLRAATTGAKSANYATQDGKSGNVQVSARFKVSAPGTSSVIRMIARLSDPVVANWSGVNCYVGEISIGSAGVSWKVIQKRAATETVVATGNSALQTILAADTDYEAFFTTNGASSPGTTLTIAIKRTSDGNWLTTAGAWQAVRTQCLNATDVTTPITGQGYSGVRVDLASGATAYLDEFTVTDFLDPDVLRKVWTSTAGWQATSAPSIVAGSFSGGTESGVAMTGTSVSWNLLSEVNDRQWGNSATGNHLFKFSAFNSSVSTRFLARNHSLFLDGSGTPTVRLYNQITNATVTSFAFTYGNWTAGRAYRVIWSAGPTYVRFAVHDTIANTYLKTDGTFGATFNWCFDQTLATPANPGGSVGISTVNGASTTMTIGTYTAGPGGSAAVAPSSATVSLNGTQVFAPTLFDGVDTTGSATNGTYNAATGTYTAPASGSADTLTIASQYRPAQTVPVAITLSSAAATTFTLTAPTPSSGNASTPSGNFTVTPNAIYSGTITLTPSGAGLSTPIVLTFSASSAPQTFTITPTSAGTVTLSPSNNGGLTNPSAVTYTSLAQLATVYVASNGSDTEGTGTGAIGTPYLTIARALSRAASVATVNCRGGDSFNENVVLTSGKTLQSYGTGRATITVGTGTTITAPNCDNITINNLNLFSTASRAIFVYTDDGARRTGGVTITNNVCTSPGNCVNVRVVGPTFQISGTGAGYNNVTISGNDIQGGTGSANGIGIYFSNSGASADADLVRKHFSNVLIENNVVHDCDFVGIVLGNVDSTTGTGAAQCIIRRNRVYNINANGNYPSAAGPAGIFPIYSDGVLVQSNVVRNVKASTAGTDGCGLDADANTTNCTFERNYVADCASGFLQYQGVGDPIANGGHTVRWNVFDTVGNSAFYALGGIRLTGSGSCRVYGNVVRSTGISPAVYVANPLSKTFYNNILASANGVPTVHLESTSGQSLQGNSYQSGAGNFLCRIGASGSTTDYTSLAAWRTAATAEAGSRGFLTTSPFVGYGSVAPTITDPDAIPTLTGYRVQSGSTLDGAGLDINTLFGFSPGTADFLGETVSVPYSVGAVDAPSTVATAYTLTGPTSGSAGAASASFTVAPNGLVTGSITVTPSGGGLSTPVVLTFSNSSVAQTFTITPASAGTVTLTPTNSASLANPSGLTYTATAPTATAYTLTGPSSGAVGSPSTSFTVTPNAAYTGSVTVTPSGGGLSTPVVLTFSSSATPQTFTITPASSGTVTLTPTNSGGLTNPSGLSYTAASSSATAYSLMGPSIGTTGVASASFTVTPNGTYSGSVTIALSGGGLSTPIVLTFSGSSSPLTFTLTPTSGGTVTLTPTNSGGLTNPAVITYTTGTSTATAYALTGPTSGSVGSPSASFSVTPNAAYTGSVTVTPSGGGLSTPIVLTFSSSSAAQSFTVTPTSPGTVTLTPTNSGSLSNPAAKTYTATAVTASAYTLTGPSSGSVGVTSSTFSVAPNGPYTGSVVVTPSGGGVTSPVVLTFSNSSTAQTFTLTPAAPGTVTLTPTNSGGLSDPTPAIYTAIAAGGGAISDEDVGRIVAAIMTTPIEANGYTLKVAMKLILAAAMRPVGGFATTGTNGAPLAEVDVVVGNVPLPTPTVGGTTTVYATMQGLNRKSVNSVNVSST